MGHPKSLDLTTTQTEGAACDSRKKIFWRCFRAIPEILTMVFGSGGAGAFAALTPPPNLPFLLTSRHAAGSVVTVGVGGKVDPTEVSGLRRDVSALRQDLHAFQLETTDRFARIETRLEQPAQPL